MKTKKMNEYAKMTAVQLLEALDLFKIPVDPFKVAKEMKLDFSQDFDIEKIGKEIEGEAFVENGKPKVWVSPLRHKNRRKFTMAHELGHVINDILPNIKKSEGQSYEDDASNLIFHRSGENSFREYSANEFAAQLLMPKEKIIDETQKYTNEKPVLMQDFIEHMAKTFEVSENAMTVRLIRLNIIK